MKRKPSIKWQQETIILYNESPVWQRWIVTTILASSLLFACQGNEEQAEQWETQALNLSPFATEAAPGLVAGVRTWRVPPTPNGLIPNQSWFSIGSAPDGDVYISAADAVTNAALYRLENGSNQLSYVGDARSASESVNNWLPGETVQRFHARPLWYRNRIYQASADFTAANAGYLNSRGFHWYAYDERKEIYKDLSVSEPGGVGAANMAIMATTLDKKNGLIYGFSSPLGNLYQYDIKNKVTKDLGRHPLITTQFFNATRFMWADSNGRVYLQVGGGSVSYWDPLEGFGSNPDWATGLPLYTGQWSRDGKRLYIMDLALNLFVFDDDARSFTLLRTGVVPSQHFSPFSGTVRVRNMQLSANEKKIYFINDTAPVNSLFEWDFPTSNEPRALVDLASMDSQITALHNVVTGADSWDAQGQFYVSVFGNLPAFLGSNILFMGIDPVRVKAAVGALPGVSMVSVQTERGYGLLRRGDTSTALQILVESKHGKKQAIVSLPAGASEARMPCSGKHGTEWQVIPDGDTYLTGLTCQPGDRDYCNNHGRCNSAGTACDCHDDRHRSPADQCKTWRRSRGHSRDHQ